MELIQLGGGYVGVLSIRIYQPILHWCNAKQKQKQTQYVAGYQILTMAGASFSYLIRYIF